MAGEAKPTGSGSLQLGTTYSALQNMAALGSSQSQGAMVGRLVPKKGAVFDQAIKDNVLRQAALARSRVAKKHALGTLTAPEPVQPVGENWREKYETEAKLVEDLRSEMEGLKTQLKNDRTIQSSLQTRNNQFREDLSSLQRMFEDQGKELLKVQGELGSASRLLIEAGDHKQRVQEALERVESENGETLSKERELRETMDTLQKKLEESERSASESKAAAFESEATIVVLQEELSGAQHESKALERLKEELADTKARHKLDIAGMEKEINLIKTTCAELEDETSTLRNKASLATVNNSLVDNYSRKDEDRYNKELLAEKKITAELQKSVSQLRGQLATRDAQLLEMEKALTRLHNREQDPNLEEALHVEIQMMREGFATLLDKANSEAAGLHDTMRAMQNTWNGERALLASRNKLLAKKVKLSEENTAQVQLQLDALHTRAAKEMSAHIKGGSEGGGPAQGT